MPPCCVISEILGFLANLCGFLGIYAISSAFSNKNIQVQSLKKEFIKRAFHFHPFIVISIKNFFIFPFCTRKFVEKRGDFTSITLIEAFHKLFRMLLEYMNPTNFKMIRAKGCKIHFLLLVHLSGVLHPKNP